MSAPRIKFCGFTRGEDIEAALALGVDYLGLILVPESARALTPERARVLRQQIGGRAQVVMLTRDAEATDIKAWIERISPDVLQFHGRESPARCAAFGHKWWKAVPMGELTSSSALDAFMAQFPGAERLLFDSHGGTQSGGRGHRFDWNRVAGIARNHVLAGGLNPDNVAAAVATLTPWAVDVASGIEASPGVKDPTRMQAFVAAVRAGAETAQSGIPTH